MEMRSQYRLNICKPRDFAESQQTKIRDRAVSFPYKLHSKDTLDLPCTKQCSSEVLFVFPRDDLSRLMEGMLAIGGPAKASIPLPTSLGAGVCWPEFSCEMEPPKNAVPVLPCCHPHIPSSQTSQHWSPGIYHPLLHKEWATRTTCFRDVYFYNSKEYLVEHSNTYN